MSEGDAGPIQDLDAEIRRQMVLCAVCGYCTGLCEVFRRVETKREFGAADLGALAHLCHNCRACWYACQYAPPHPFAITVPQILEQRRRVDYARFAHPRLLAGLGWGWMVWLVLALCLLLVPLSVFLVVPGEVLFTVHRGPGAFYRIIPWETMTAAAALAAGWGAVSLVRGMVSFWRSLGAGGTIDAGSLAAALGDVLTLRNLDGGGPGCGGQDDRPSGWRRVWHHGVFYGFLLCLLSTVAATVSHHVHGLPAPYPLFSLPVLSGTLGGIAMVAGSLGLMVCKRAADPAATLPGRSGDYAFIVSLVAVAGSGLAVLALRDTAAMGMILAAHLGAVLGFFLLMPVGKFVHGGLRACALLHAAMERRALSKSKDVSS